MSNQDWSAGIKKLERKLNKLDGTHDISYDELFNTSFMNSYTQHSTIDEFFDAGGFEFETEEEFVNISEELMDKHVRGSANFDSWQKILIMAGKHWATEKMRSY